MTYLIEHIAFYTLLSSPVWAPIYLFWLFTKAVEKVKSKPTPHVDTPAETIARRASVKADVVKFAAMRAQG